MRKEKTLFYCFNASQKLKRHWAKKTHRFLFTNQRSCNNAVNIYSLTVNSINYCHSFVIESADTDSVFQQKSALLNSMSLRKQF